MAFLPDVAFEVLERAQGCGRLAHAYLISGPAGSGKRELAARIASLMTGSEKGIAHPDVHVAEPESRSRQITIEQTRELERELQMRSVVSGRKVAVIFDADRMNPNAANSFLKTLEEPPRNSLILLVTAQPEVLLETIVSRCIPVDLRPPERRVLTPEQHEMALALRGHFQRGEQDVAAALRLARCFFDLLAGMKEKISAENEAALKAEESRYRQTTESRAWLDGREDYYKAVTQARYLAARTGFADVLMQWWADVARQQGGAGHLDLLEFAGDTASLAEKLTPGEVLQKIEVIEVLRENFSRNVQEQLAAEVAFIKLFA
jgi:DNA polymerase III subunit delta'